MIAAGKEGISWYRKEMYRRSYEQGYSEDN